MCVCVCILYRINLEEIGINTGNCVDSAQGRNYWRALVNAALNLRVPCKYLCKDPVFIYP